MLIQRHINLIDEMFSNISNNISELSKKYNVTDRTLRNDIALINQTFYKHINKDLLETKINTVVITIDKKSYNTLLKKIDFSEYTLNSDERDLVILLDIFLLNNNFKLSNLCDKYAISKATLRQSIKNINNNLYMNKLFLSLNTNTAKAYFVQGDELDVRKYMISHIRHIKNYFVNNQIILNYIDSILYEFSKSISFQDSKKTLKDFLEKENTKINDDSFEIISYYLFISKNRNQKSHCIKEENIENNHFLTNTKEYQKIYMHFLSNDFLEADCKVLTDFYLGLHNYKENYSFFLDWIKIEQLVDKMLINLSHEFSINFQQDNILRKELINHIKPAIYRMKNNLSLTESIIDEVKKEYSEVYYKTKRALVFLGEILEVDLDNDEIAFITIMIKRAIDRNYPNEKNHKIKVLIVCGFGYSSSKFLKENLQENFDIDIIDTIPYNQLSNYPNFKNIDVVISTLDFILNSHEVIKVNAIFQEEDIYKLLKYGFKKRKRKILESELLNFVLKNRNNNKEKILKEIRSNFQNYIYTDLLSKKEKRFYDFLNEKNVKLNLDVTNFDDLLKIIGDMMYQNSYTGLCYEYNLKAQITKYGDYIKIGEKTILPHGELDNNVKKTGFVLITLKNPIIFLNHKISIIIALASKNTQEHSRAIIDINNYLKMQNFEQEIIKIKSFKELMKFLKLKVTGDD